MKRIEIEQNIMQEMRELARLFLQFQKMTEQHGIAVSEMGTEDMFMRTHNDKQSAVSQVINMD